MLPNSDLDSGEATKAAEYSLTDDTYAMLLTRLSDGHFDKTSPALRANILDFYSDLSAPLGTIKDQGHWHGVLMALEQLKLVPSLPGAAESPVQHAPSAPITNDAPVLPPAIVIGFVGGFISHDNPVHAEVQLAARLRKAYPSGVDVETFENHRGDKARKKVMDLLDANHDGALTTDEKQNARIIIYGHSWGGSETLALARELERVGVAVLLTVQVDSVSKIHQNDAIIPANVVQAVNFFQSERLPPWPDRDSRRRFKTHENHREF